MGRRGTCDHDQLYLLGRNAWSPEECRRTRPPAFFFGVSAAVAVAADLLKITVGRVARQSGQRAERRRSADTLSVRVSGFYAF